MASAAPLGTRLLAATLGVLLAAAVGIVRPASADAVVTTTISPATAGNTAVRAPHKITVAGTAPAGPIEAARLIALHVDGSRSEQLVSSTALNRNPALLNDTEDYLRISGGEITGRLTLGCLFGSPTNACFHEDTRAALLEITVGGASYTSNELRVDYTRPTLLLEREVIAPDKILVRFSEPVHNPDGELGVDWRVDGGLGSVESVEISSAGRRDCVYAPGDDATAGETGCARVLHLSQPVDEDATPQVEYWLIGHNVPDRSEHYDFASNQVLFRTETPEVYAAVDKIRPAVPTIESIDGKTPSEDLQQVLSKTTAPLVRVANVVAGHTVEVTFRSGSGSQTVTADVPTGANAVDVQPRTALSDGAHQISALAIDPSGNRSDDANLQSARADGTNEAQYVLDTVRPRLLSVTPLTRRTAVATFSEDIVPGHNAGQWKIGDVNVTAQGTGATRRLESQTDLSDGAVVTWSGDAEAAPGSTGRYADRAGNALPDVAGVKLGGLPAVTAPSVTRPSTTQFVNATSYRIEGTAPAGTKLVAELFAKGGDAPLATAAVSNGRWAINRELGSDGRYEFLVRLRDTGTGVVSSPVPVPDIVRDTVAPKVDVTAPALEAPSLDNATGRQQLGVGDPVRITWTATDAAQGDPKMSDHGDTATIVLVSDNGTRVAVAKGIQHQAGREQTYTYTLKQADLAGEGQRVLSFDVVVNDLARNSGSDSSAEVLLLADRVGYTPVLTKATTASSLGTIEARFPVPLQGQTTPAEWLIDGVPSAQAVEMQAADNGSTVVKLVVATGIDPNATPLVQYKAPAPDANGFALRTENGRWVSSSARRTVDAVIPALSVKAPDTAPVIDADHVTFTGTTDITSTPNTVAAFRAYANGARYGSAIATTAATKTGQFTLDVPLTPNTTNRIVLQAIDPSGNRSHTRPTLPYTVVEDSLAPSVTMTSPRSGSTVGPSTTLRWSTIEANKKLVKLEYRELGGQWQYIAGKTADDGVFTWSVPTHLAGRVFSVRVTSFDVTGKSGAYTTDGLRADFAPPRLTKVRAIAPNKVRVFFDEPVKMGRKGITVDGVRVRKVKGKGDRRTLILRKWTKRTTPLVVDSKTFARDSVGNRLRGVRERADRAFVFPVRKFDAKRLSAKRVKLTWRDTRNRPGHIKAYRIIRDGKRIKSLDWDDRKFIDRRARGKHRYVIRVVDTQRRLSLKRVERVR